MIQPYKLLLLACLITFSCSCKKLIEINPPTKTINTEKVFESPEMVDAALAGLYSQLITGIGSMTFSNGGFTIYSGMSSDELVNKNSTIDAEDYQFLSNKININNGVPGNGIWVPAYQIIYKANAIIEGINNSRSPNVTDSTRAQGIGEAKFVRAFCYFYLVNSFGDVPLVLTTDYTKTVLMERTPADGVYTQMISDLEDAKSKLGSDYAITNGERIRPNKWAATALLARVHLYVKHWEEAEKNATAVINAGQFTLLAEPEKVFLKNSREAIWQLMLNAINIQPGNVTWEGKNMVPLTRYTALDPSTQLLYQDPDFFPLLVPYLVPAYYLSDQQASAFEGGDKRKEKWTDSLPTPAIAPYNSMTYYFAFKYTEQESQVNGPMPQYYMVLRLAEQYLIRAEARAQLNNNAGAADDINIIRGRAGLANTTAGTREALLDAVAQERRVELFAEWGHRWLDLKRTQKADKVLSQLTYKQPWQTTQLLYPIPVKETSDNPHIIQNPGY
ncbi:RagB/SusD family nutrient uptake outer membrane protein [Chitinophaga arvensicola]|uniref:Starch-binding associating with outer membrane n=1 Tax=Chitinophaga arvensicola TaxID=29529 RepID=A0A1I0RV60_9BACT|nr:RagB/SusD family nutrient uptake outer membrane protein [Chitinophaga arvensicola]SEW45377.1 Starch-binding associating with outer membrane [Chitinophaga arvensicola]